MTTGAHPSKIDSVRNERDQCSSEPVEVQTPEENRHRSDPLPPSQLPSAGKVERRLG